MTDDYRQELYQDIYPWSKPRDYHYWKVSFTVYNKITEQYNTIHYYLSTKFTEKWLSRIISVPDLPRDYFTYSIKYKEVQDQEDIVFHHITSQEDFNQIAVRYFLMCCAVGRWRKSLKLKLHKYIMKVREKLKFNLHKYSIVVIE